MSSYRVKLVSLTSVGQMLYALDDQGEIWKRNIAEHNSSWRYVPSKWERPPDDAYGRVALPPSEA